MKALISLFLAISSCNVLAWSGFAHQTAGEIAERHLNQKTRIALNELIGPEKLSLASVWADMVRDDEGFEKFKTYHFIDPLQADARAVLSYYPELLLNPETERSVKIVALRFLIHIVEDVHQPLHAGIREDAGGNYCKVEWLPGQIFNLHEVWDGKIVDLDVMELKSAISPLKYFTPANYADDILKKNILTESEVTALKSAPPSEWIKESQLLEKSIYPEDANNDYCRKTSTKYPRITGEYKTQAVQISRLRILQGGLRLAGLLDHIFKDGMNSGKDSTLNTNQILNKLLIKEAP